MVADPANGTFAWQSLRETSLTGRIRAQIQRYLDDENLGPGDRLPSERDLATYLGVSRPSVREAIKSLQAEGRLSVRHGQGVFVEEPATSKRLKKSLATYEHDMDELYAMREVLEVPAARWAAQRQDPAGRALIDTAHQQLVEASLGAPPDFDELQHLDIAFHQSIVTAAGNKFLAQTQGVLSEILSQGMTTTLDMPGRLEASRGEHRAILDAILDADPAAAAEAARTHVLGARRAAMTRVAQTIGQVPHQRLAYWESAPVDTYWESGPVDDERPGQ
jgi:GntR family transcriptional repressor for pyruvate dehydrogenase complex